MEIPMSKPQIILLDVREVSLAADIARRVAVGPESRLNSPNLVFLVVQCRSPFRRILTMNLPSATTDLLSFLQPVRTEIEKWHPATSREGTACETEFGERDAGPPSFELAEPQSDHLPFDAVIVLSDGTLLYTIRLDPHTGEVVFFAMHFIQAISPRNALYSGS